MSDGVAVALRGIFEGLYRRHNPVHNLKTKLRRTAPRDDGAVLVPARRRPDRAKGRVPGPIGPNGSGKSTLLRVMARIYPPTTGTVVAHGTVAPMIELGVGFHPDLTGHESIFPNTSLFRLFTQETKAIYGEIFVFVGLSPTRLGSPRCVLTAALSPA